MLKVGIALTMAAEKNVADSKIILQHIKLGERAEKFGFDSIFAFEHHFTDYILSPTPFEILAFLAARTKNIQLGTSVIVLPWHDPIIIAEQIAVLNILSNNRCVFGFGSGGAESEFKGFRIPKTEAHSRFIEAIEIILKSCSHETFSYNGVFYKIPALSIRPKVDKKIIGRFYATSGNLEVLEIISRLGLGLLLSTQKEWNSLREKIMLFNKLPIGKSHFKKNIIVFTMISVDINKQKAYNRALKYMTRDLLSTNMHYILSEKYSVHDPRKITPFNYSGNFNNPQKKINVKDYLEFQIIGTPADCVKQIKQLCIITGTEHIVFEFSYGGMPYSEAKKNMSLFTEKVLQKIKN